MTNATPIEPDDGTVISLLSARTGLSFSPRQLDAVRTAIAGTMRRAGIADRNEYVRILANDARLLDELISELTVGESYFFREMGHFRFIRSAIMSEIRERRDEKNVLRAWSAGCSSGEEPYSLAMLFDREGLAHRTHVLATDICRKALAKARQAVFHSWSLRGESGLQAKPYLVVDNERYRIDPRIRSRVRFEYLNLALDVYPSIVTGTWQVDLILCRNVLIYFDEDTVRSVARRLFESLAVGGWLITSSGDPPLDHLVPFETISNDLGVFYRRPAAVESSGSILLPHQGSDARLGLPAEPVRLTTVGETGASTEATDEKEANDRRPNQEVEIDPPDGSAGRSDRPRDPLDDARRALAQGEYRHAADLTQDQLTSATACAIHVQALANIDGVAAEVACANGVTQHPLSTELHYLHTILFMEADQCEAAVQAARRLVFLDRSLAIGYFLLGSALRRLGDVRGARRSLRSARDLCARRPADEPVPLTDGELAGRLIEAAELQLAGLGADTE